MSGQVPASGTPDLRPDLTCVFLRPPHLCLSPETSRSGSRSVFSFLILLQTDINVNVMYHPPGNRLLFKSLFVYYCSESIKRELKTRTIYECRCDERLKTKAEESTHLECNGLIGELEHLKIETRLIDEMFASVMGEYVSLK